MKSWLSCLFLLFAVSALGVKSGEAQSTDDLPAAPSAVNQPKAAPPKPPAPPPPAPETQPPAVGRAGDPGPQQPPPTEATTDHEVPKSGGTDSGGTTIYSTVNEVSVVFTVTDKHNHYVKDLARTDFRVIDDERPVEDIRSFRRETDLPLMVGL